MPLYLCKFKYEPTTWAALVNKPEDRRKNAAQGFEATGGKLLGFWYAFGECDGYTLFESPDNKSAAASLVRFAQSGALKALETSVLIPVEEMMEAWDMTREIPWAAPGGELARP
jgi:uncharacterized protein with GYD domain